MKFKVGDKVKVTTGKDKGKTGVITRVLPKQQKVVVEGMNQYTRHIKQMLNQPGQKTVLERPLSTAKIAILNEKDQTDRIAYSVDSKGNKTRVYKKSGGLVPEPKK